MKTVRNLGCILLGCAGLALAQPSITDVVNAASRIPSGFPSYGVAQGAILLVQGKGLGPDTLQQASFPLPTTDGLAGVTIQVAVAGSTVDGIMVYAGPTEVAAILPSGTPVGAGTLTLNNNGQTATAPVTVVAAAFGAFTQSQTGSGPALAFNLGPDGTPTLNTLTQPAQPNQTVMLNGTGLGAIGSDETQSGVTDTPGTTLTLWVGNQEAALMSAGRGACCAGIDPAFAVPQGVAGWDVIQFVVPEGITGCHVPVAVQIGDVVSNFSTIAVSTGATCTDPTGFDSSLLQNLTGGTVRFGAVTLDRSSTKITAAGIGAVESKSDTGGASFIQYDLTQIQSSSAFASIAAVGACMVITNKSMQGQPPVIPTFTGLDAGSVINVKGPSGTKQMKPSSDLAGTYSADFGTSTVLQNPPPGFPGLPGSGPPFLEAGSYTVDNGGGGADVGAFTATLAIPTPMTWDNQDQITAVKRSDGVTVKWSGGSSSAMVNIIGSSSARVGTANLSGTFICTAPVSAGQFAVPPIVTLSLPPSAAPSGTGPGATPTGILGVQSSVNGTFTAPGLDIGWITSSVSSVKNLSYQ